MPYRNIATKGKEQKKEKRSILAAPSLNMMHQATNRVLNLLFGMTSNKRTFETKAKVVIKIISGIWKCWKRQPYNIEDKSKHPINKRIQVYNSTQNILHIYQKRKIYSYTKLSKIQSRVIHPKSIFMRL